MDKTNMTYGNKDDLYEAMHGLDIFEKNFCMNVAETEKGELTFRCGECPFCNEATGICAVHKFAAVFGERAGYDMDSFGCMFGLSEPVVIEVEDEGGLER